MSKRKYKTNRHIERPGNVMSLSLSIIMYAYPPFIFIIGGVIGVVGSFFQEPEDRTWVMNIISSTGFAIALCGIAILYLFTFKCASCGNKSVKVYQFIFYQKARCFKCGKAEKEDDFGEEA